MLRILGGALLFSLLSFSQASARGRQIYSARYAGLITPVAAEFLIQALDQAQQQGAELLVIELDTPGGLDPSMREIVKAILNASVPVAVYVSPSGARAASAGVFIAYAAHFAAMAPGTNIGAAHPVMIGGIPQVGKEKEKTDRTMEEKVVNDAASYLKSIAAERGRDVDFAEKAVTESRSLTAEQALQKKVVDVVARDFTDLLNQLHGRRVQALKGKVLQTQQAATVPVAMSGRQRFLAVIADPNVAMLLMSLGAAGLFIELYSPGLILPGVVGVVSMVLAFYSFQTLSANFAGVVLILLGLLLFILEIKIISYGLLSLGGAASVLLGSTFLFRAPQVSGIGLSLSTVLTTLAGLLALTAALAWMAWSAHRRKPTTGEEGMLGLAGIAETDLAPETDGSVFIHGEIWKARALDAALPKGTPVAVVRVEGLTLTVRRK
ncbi:MAG: nodulation protein NfeD [Elusimicrobia bacterium]|nr:nodulation protein NfeD [Elusimicrobiota bacterium]